MEILSPVGAKEQLLAAVRSGADAVYLGLKDFNARRNADNFESEALDETVRYCHARNVKVYVTLNTLVKNKEIPKAASAIKEAAYAGADAIIVQDLAMYRLAKEIAPDMPIHASTQMSIHNPAGVKILEKLGFCRVVPARELSLKEIKAIRDNSDIELEVFVHGALCMCISGQCYLSSVLGRRSANRGLCAQPCRLDFKTDAGGHALSLKDISIIKDLKELEQIGVDSAKIEGRMKRPEYVRAATKACKKALSGQEFDTDTLKAIFSRSGFTDGYLYNKRDRNMFGYRTKEDVTAAAPILKSIANEYRNELPLIPINMRIEIKSDTPVVLTVYDNDTNISVSGILPERAINRDVDKEFVKRSLEKCGGTPYYLNSLEAEIEDGLSLSVSELNSIRKEALSKFELAKGCSKPYAVKEFDYLPKAAPVNLGFKKQAIYARFEKAEQIVENADKIILDYEEIYNNQALCREYKGKLIAELPALMFSDIEAERKLLELKKLGVTEIYAPNLYAIHIARETGMEICGGFGLNILNEIALEQYRLLGVKCAEISFETSIENYESMNKTIPCGLIAYGKMPLMTFRNCPAKSKQGCGSCGCKAKILDRYDNEFTILCKGRKYGRLLNPQPIYMGDKIKALENADYLTVYFTDEPQNECMKIINMIKNREPFSKPFTRGLYFKEIL